MAKTELFKTEDDQESDVHGLVETARYDAEGRLPPDAPGSSNDLPPLARVPLEQRDHLTAAKDDYHEARYLLAQECFHDKDLYEENY